MSCVSHHRYDYAAARADALKGVPLTQVAEAHKIPYAALQQYALRHKWKTDKMNIKSIVSDHVSHSFKSMSDKWLAQISSKAQTILTDLNSYDFTSKLHSLKPLDYLNALDLVDRIARRTYSLDKDQSSTKVGLAINVNIPGPSTHDKVIDIATLDSTQ